MDAWDLNPTTASSDSLACGAIAIDPANPDRIFVGTGDGDEAIFFGVGPVVSSTAARTGRPSPSRRAARRSAGSAFYALAVDPGNTDRVVAGTIQGVYRREPDRAAASAGRARPARPGRSERRRRAHGRRDDVLRRAVRAARCSRRRTGTRGTSSAPASPTANVGRVGLAVRADRSDRRLCAGRAASDNSLLGVCRLEATAGLAAGHGASRRSVRDAAIGFAGQVRPRDRGRSQQRQPHLPRRLDVAVGRRVVGRRYRWTVTSAARGATLTYSMTKTYIGNSVHADIHASRSRPATRTSSGSAATAAASTRPIPTGAGDVFVPRNTGLQTLTMNQLGQHPTEDAVVFGGTQDNGGARFTGEEAWLHSVWGDAARSSSTGTTPTGSSRRTWARRSTAPPTAAPATTTRRSTSRCRPATARCSTRRSSARRRRRRRPRRSASRSAAGDLDQRDVRRRLAVDPREQRDRRPRRAHPVAAVRVATRLYAGTTDGRRVSASTRVGRRVDADAARHVGGANALPTGRRRSRHRGRPGDATGDSIYITFGGVGDWRHVWRFNGTQWQQRSGPAAGDSRACSTSSTTRSSCDPAQHRDGVRRRRHRRLALDGRRQNWAPFSSGLPDAAVLDLALHNPRRLLRASTYGRGVCEYRSTASPRRRRALRPRHAARPGPVHDGERPRRSDERRARRSRTGAGPTSSSTRRTRRGNYQFPITPGTTIDFEQFMNELTDDFRQRRDARDRDDHDPRLRPGAQPRRHAGQQRARDAAPGERLRRPAEPAGRLRGERPERHADQHGRTGGRSAFATLNDVRVGFPKIAAFDLTSNLLPPPASLAGNDHHCVLALLHHASDPFTATQTVTDLLSLGERKAAHKNLKVVQFTGRCRRRRW